MPPTLDSRRPIRGRGATAIEIVRCTSASYRALSGLPSEPDEGEPLPLPTGAAESRSEGSVETSVGSSDTAISEERPSPADKRVLALPRRGVLAADDVPTEVPAEDSSKDVVGLPED